MGNLTLIDKCGQYSQPEYRKTYNLMAQTHDLFLQRISLCDIQVSEMKTNASKVNWGINKTVLPKSSA